MTPIVRSENELGTMPGVERTIERTKTGRITRRSSRVAREKTSLTVLVGVLAMATMVAAGVGARAFQNSRTMAQGSSAGVAAAAAALPAPKCVTLQK